MKEGEKIPAIRLKNDTGEEFELESVVGGPSIVYFYPKAGTKGCTQQACDFNNQVDELIDREIVVIGISPDSPKKLANFRKKHGLDFVLLSDEDHKAAEAFNVWQEKSMYGRKYMGVIRSTFVFDENGILEKIYEKVRVRGHVETVIEELIDDL